MLFCPPYLRTFLRLALALSVAVIAHATPVLRVQLDASSPVDCFDNSGCDDDSRDGVISTAYSFGGFSVNVTTGLTKPEVGTSLQPYLDLNSINTNIPGGATLRILFSENGFTAAPVTFFGLFGGTMSGGTVTASAYLDETNALFGTGTLIASSGPHSGPLLDDDFTALKTPASTYSLTQELVIHTTSSGSYGADFELSSETATVPEPSGMSLAAVVLLLAGRFCRRNPAPSTHKSVR